MLIQEIHLTGENVLESIGELVGALQMCGSVLATGIGKVKSKFEKRRFEEVFEELNQHTFQKGRQLALAAGEGTAVAGAVLSLIVGLSLAVDAYKAMANAIIDKQKSADGRYPCGHNDGEHEAMTDEHTDADSVLPIAGKMRGHGLDQ